MARKSCEPLSCGSQALRGALEWLTVACQARKSENVAMGRIGARSAGAASRGAAGAARPDTRTGVQRLIVVLSDDQRRRKT